jgi:hypothetical protein
MAIVSGIETQPQKVTAQRYVKQGVEHGVRILLPVTQQIRADKAKARAHVRPDI